MNLDETISLTELPGQIELLDSVKKDHLRKYGRHGHPDHLKVAKALESAVHLMDMDLLKLQIKEKTEQRLAEKTKPLTPSISDTTAPMGEGK